MTGKNLEKKLSLLIDIYKALARDFDISQSFLHVLQILQSQYGITSGAVLIFDLNQSRIKLVASVGYDVMPVEHEFEIGEGLTGKVARSGKAVVVPQISKESSYLNKFSKQKFQNPPEQSFIGIPLKWDNLVLGVLSVHLKYGPKRDFASTRKLLVLVASALVQALRLQQLAEEEKKRLLDENTLLKQRLQTRHSLKNIIGTSHEMQEVYHQVKQVAPAGTTVLIRGETGTGKELIAKAIHYNSDRSTQSFISVNCAAIPENLVESEFFGHEKGAFTGALNRKKGRFELANGGTIFLDEIGELSLATQVKLLRVLQEHEFERVGGTETIKSDVRIICATNADLSGMIKKGAFREDLFYRLNVFAIFIPALRERKSDILLLADHFMLKYGRVQKKSIKRISTPAIDMLMRYHWPGNVRELENCIERAVLVCQNEVIHSYHLPPTLQTAESSNTAMHQSLDSAVAAYEKELIQDALKSTSGNCAKAARLLGATQRIINYKMKKLKIDAKRYKNS